jgi:hypothetical protein
MHGTSNLEQKVHHIAFARSASTFESIRILSDGLLTRAGILHFDVPCIAKFLEKGVGAYQRFLVSSTQVRRELIG